MIKNNLKQQFSQAPANSVGLLSLLDKHQGDPESTLQAVARLLRDHPDEAAHAVMELYEKYKSSELRANTDGMTGLFNKTYMMDQLGKLHSGERPTYERRKQEGNYIVFIDLDGFKPINDNYGHAAGDRALMTVADALKKCVRKTDDVGRMGGDEFAIILYGISQNDALRKRDQIIGTLETLSFPWQKTQIAVRGSVGIWPFNAEKTAEMNMHCVDKIMYRVKQAKGDTRHHLYTVDTLPVARPAR